MKLSFDEQTWSQLEEYLKVAQLCGSAAVDLCAPAKGVSQRILASVGMEKDVSPPEAEHALDFLRRLRNSTNDAAQGFASAVARIDALMAQLDPAAPRPRSRQKA